MRTPHRIPVGTVVTVTPTGVSTQGLHRQLLAAGMSPLGIVTRAGLRRKFGNACSALPCRAVPTTCRHHEPEVDATAQAHASTFLAAGHTWVYDTGLPTLEQMREQIDRAHRAGLAAVALRRTGAAGAMSLGEVLDADRHATVRVPNDQLRQDHARYATLSRPVLLDLGFDVVLDWDDTTSFELMPPSWDARGVSTEGVAVVGDLHGCARTFLDRMLPELGTDRHLSNPARLVISVGDIHDKGDPDGSVELIRWWLQALRSGRALMVDSNHNRKLVRHLAGHPVKVSPALADTLAAIDAQPDAEQLKADIVASFGRLPSHLVFNDLAVVHAGLTEELVGKVSAKARGFMLYARNETTPWQWTGSQTLVHGHEPVTVPSVRRAEPDPERPGHVPGVVIDIDTGVVQNGRLSAYVHRDGSFVTVNTHPEDLIEATTDQLVDVVA